VIHLNRRGLDTTGAPVDCPPTVRLTNKTTGVVISTPSNETGN